jgi:hypothetical protein
VRLLGLLRMTTAVLVPSLAYAYKRRYDPYKWCTTGADGSSNCDFLRLDQ